MWACGVDASAIEEAGRYRAGDRCGVWPWRLEPNVCVFCVLLMCGLCGVELCGRRLDARETERRVDTGHGDGLFFIV